MREDPSGDLCPPTGLFLVARQAAAVVGCIGLLLLPDGLGEVRRVFVEPCAASWEPPCARPRTRPAAAR